MSWAQNSAANLLPLSIEQSRLAVALKEWLYTGDMYDLEEPVETCELCEHPDIRYQFKIINRHNGNEMLVGSECINKFGISATDELGNVLDREGSRRRVNRDRRFLVNEARKRRMINTLVALSAVEEEFDINSFISYVLDRDAFTPNQLALLFWRFDQREIEYSPRDFKIVIRRDREKNQLRQMEDWKIQKLWASMSTSQRTWVRRNTNYEP
ncbi:hypothetical protein BI364_00100 [Acidihalobacter yilgarnensis]|uniref:Uncharacterized protein n=1 Tax=Acidihalobacter yilgarnensis TaxID=2819280 RepID=A0A1D8IJM2_9GAMM|nr:hypothetical protein [Acidihalobacter yilgarnensis]AOU96633.1 hypothetical protein BI364_00100 [Acidihalobacter yilgarnensis]